MASVDQIRKAQRAEGTAAILAIGTANPPKYLEQSNFPDFYFNVTNSQHMTQLKKKMQRICDKTMIKKRHMYVIDELITNGNSYLHEYSTLPLDARQEKAAILVSKLGEEAANKAIKEWGHSKSKITHLICCTTVASSIPGFDCRIVKLLGLDLSVKRLMLYQQGCNGGGTVLRMAKELAENNKGARVLIVTSEVTMIGIQNPNETDLDILVTHALFGDGSAALIVGADPIPNIEKPIFELISTAPTLVPDSSEALTGTVNEKGLLMHIGKEVPNLVADNIENRLIEVFKPLGISDWNSIFWVAHPGGPAILDQIQAKLALQPDKLRACRHVLAEYGNMSTVTVLFVLDEMRKKSTKDGLKTAGEGLEWGVLFGFGPGVTIETIVLRSANVA